MNATADTQIVDPFGGGGELTTTRDTLKVILPPAGIVALFSSISPLPDDPPQVAPPVLWHVHDPLFSAGEKFPDFGNQSRTRTPLAVAEPVFPTTIW
jgi:hypothetical protein